jgi:UDP-N-acetylglucosamine 1-carboxyvinyltransferase
MLTGQPPKSPRYSNDGTLIVEGARPISGRVRVRGAKNSVPKNMVAALLTTDKTTLQGVAAIRDVSVMAALIESIGGSVQSNEVAGTFVIDPNNLTSMSVETAAHFSGISRIPILLCGPLLHRFGQAFVPNLGGCAIGERPIDFHLDALRRFGATLEQRPDGILLHCENGLRGTKIRLDFPSVGATEQVILTAVLAKGETELSNAAVEPEIMDLIAQLQKMGAQITVDTDRIIRILGVERLRGCIHHTMPDRLEVASWACVAAATNGEIFVEGARHIDLFAFLNAYTRAGGDFEVEEHGIRFMRAKSGLKAIVVETGVHPGFMTDWQQPFATMLTQAAGVSIIHETVYEGRFGYIHALNTMGANISLRTDCLGSRCRFGSLNHAHSAIISGATPMRGSDIVIPDLRAGFSYVIAGLIANGTSRISNIGLIQRGYERFTEKLTDLNVAFELLG